MSTVERVACPHLVGRLEHLEWLEGAMATVGHGTSCVLLLGGEAGVGKTRLVEEFASRAGLGGAHVLTGGCVDLGEVSLPYAPVVEALRGLAREHGGPGGFLERLGAAESAADRTELARLLPELGVATPAMAAPGDGTQARLFDVILRLLEALTASGSVALILEDLHWADQSTLDLVTFLTRNAHHARVLLLGTYRSDELHRRHPLRPVLAELDRSGRVDRRVLPRFNLDEVTDQLTGILGQAPESALADDIFDRSEGNPFFVEELAAAGRGGSGPLPPTLRDILMARLERLPEDAQHVLRVAAAAGPRVDHRLLVSVAGLPVATLLEALRAAVTNHVLSPDDLGEAYTFRHALLQEALYAELLPGERTTLHTVFAETIQERPELAATNPAAALAYHWYRALDPPRALEAAVEAGRHDERVYAFPEAQTHFERALELWSKVPEPERLAGMDEVELLRRAAEAAYLAGHLDRALALATRALALIPDHEQDPLRAGLLYERLGRYRWIGGRGRDLDAFERALALVPPEPSAERARVLAAYGGALMLNDQHAASRSVCEEAIQVARQVGARQAESSALNSLGVTLAEGFGELDTGVAHLQQSRHIAEEIGSVEDISRAWCNLASVLVTGGRLEDGLGVALEGVKVSERVGLGRTEGIKHLSHAGEVLIDLGRWDDAERLLADGQPMTPGASWAAGHAQLEHARLLYLRGAFDDASRELAGVRRRPAWPNGWSGDYLLQLTAELACWQDRPADARAALVEARSRGRHCACDHWNQVDVWLRAEADLAVRARARGDDEGLRAARSNAEELLEQVRSLRQQALDSPAQQFLGISLNAAAEMTRLHGQPDPAAWDRAATHWESLEHVPRGLYARWRQAEALLATRAPRGEIEAVLRPAAATARQLGAVPLTERLEAVARRARITLSAGATDGAAAAPAGLTRREIEVLGLVADGRSNRQIGEALFISEKTASVHVSNILAKLSVASRLEAAAAAHRLGLLDTPTS